MKRLSPEVQKAVEEALADYEAEVEATELTESTKKTYLLHARHFVRWCRDDFEPGGRLQS